MKGIAAAILALVSVSSLSAQTQESLPNPKVWLRADRAEFVNGEWHDISPYHHHAKALLPSQAPQADGVINFNRSWTFDGIDDYLKIPYALDRLSGFSVLAVFHSFDSLERGLWGVEESPTRDILLTTRRALGPAMHDGEISRSENTTTLNCVVQSWADQAPSESLVGYLSLGSAGRKKEYKPFYGNFAELIVFDHPLSFLERTKYETYLGIKYGAGLLAGNYVSSTGVVLWNTSENQSFGRNISGLGRDDFFKLDQRQSGSAYDSGLLVLSVGNLAKTNHENAATLADQDFILWGDNGLPLNGRPGQGADSTLSFLQRKWLVTVSGKAEQVPTELHFDVSRLSIDPTEYVLVIDRSGQNNFSIPNLEFVQPQRQGNKKLVFKNIRWDADRSGKDHFGFARARDLFAVVQTLQQPVCTDRASGKIRINVVSGSGPYQLMLENTIAGVVRNWQQPEKSVELNGLDSGPYTLRITDGDGETRTTKFTLLIADDLKIDLGADLQLSSSNDIVLNAGMQIPPSDDVAYQWTFNSGFIGDAPQIIADQPGLYEVSVTRRKDNCVFSDAVRVTESGAISVYPNMVRAHQPFTVKVSIPRQGPVSAKLFDSRGSKLSQSQGNNSSEYQFSHSVGEAGVYMVVVQTPDGVETRKIIAH